MDPHDSGSSCGSSTSPAAGKLFDLDALLAGAGYNVRSSDLRHVAHSLERLETAMVNAPADQISLLSSDSIHHNPSDLSSWVDSMLSDISHSPSPSLPSLGYHRTAQGNGWMHHGTPHPHQITALPNDVTQPQQSQFTAVVTAMEEEDSGIALVHLLMTCAESVQRGDLLLAKCLIDEMRALLPSVNAARGIGKVAGCFVDALTLRLFASPRAAIEITGAAAALESEILYHGFYEACPYLKFSHFTANQAILEAFNGCDCVHVVDLNLMMGLQWPALIQALALRPGVPPLLRLTAIGAGASLPEIGLRLAELARSVNLRFEFRGVSAARLQDVSPRSLHLRRGEAVAVNSIMQLHRLVGGPGEESSTRGGIESVLGWVRGMNPRVVTVVEQEANHNRPEFLDRFTEALCYYSTVFDSLDSASSSSPERAVSEMYVGREIRNVLCCEGAARVERHEPLAKWAARLTRAGFRQRHLGSNAFKQASMLLSLSSAEGYCVEESEGSLRLGWHSRPLIAASAWEPVPDVVGS